MDPQGSLGFIGRALLLFITISEIPRGQSDYYCYYYFGVEKNSSVEETVDVVNALLLKKHVC